MSNEPFKVSESSGEPTWRHDGVRVVSGDRLDPNTPQTPGMDRKAAITFASAGARKLWAGTVHIHPDAKNRRSSPWRTGKRDLRDQRACSHALGQRA